MNTGAFLPGYYDNRLVVLSILISILAAYAALDLAERIHTIRGWMRVAWLYGGATAMGIGIWAMHYVGMVAFHLPVTVLYDWPTVLLSLLAAIAASAVALLLVSQPTMSMRRTFAGSVFMGAGIAGMHYIGMEAMRLQAMCVYSPGVVALSVVLAIVISFVALQLAFARKNELGRWSWRKLLSGLIMGLAIPVMHYVGMAAVRFVPTSSFGESLAHAYPITPLGLTVISVATIVILGQVCMISLVNRRFAIQARQLAEGEIQLRTIFDSLTEGIVVLDKQNNIVQMNPAATRHLGFSGNSIKFDLLKQNLEAYTLDGELIPADQWPGPRALHGDFVKNYELAMHSSVAHTREILEISTAPIVNAEGESVQVILTYRDITERKRMDQARAHLVAIVESSLDGIIGKDLHGVVTSWNKGAEQIFGYAAKEMIGKSISLLLSTGHEHEEDGILERIKRGETVAQLETVRQRKDGQFINVSLMISPIYDSNGKIVGASKIVRDITERKQMERQFRQSQKMEAIGQLTGGIAHDFNNLLAIVIGNLGLLQRMNAGNEAAQMRLKTAQKAAARGADLTRRLLALASKEELNPTNLLLENAVQETIDLAGRALGPEIRIATNFDKSLPPVYVDPTGLESALLNLAVNARDAMPKGGTLTFSTQLIHLDEHFLQVQTGDIKPGAYARVSVTDTGTGMSKETIERAFEPFFTTKARNKGTGLGLAMVYGFARQSSGIARIYSEQGNGTTVSLYLPLATEPAPALIENLPARVPCKLGGTALVVDDEADLLEIAKVYLTDMGFTVFQAENGADALETVRRLGSVDLLVTDIMMPGGMNGVELAQRLHEKSPHTRIVFSSGFPADALEERSGPLVDGPLLRKPYQRDEFEEAIQTIMQEELQPQGNGVALDAGAGI